MVTTQGKSVSCIGRVAYGEPPANRVVVMSSCGARQGDQIWVCEPERERSANAPHEQVGILLQPILVRAALLRVEQAEPAFLICSLVESSYKNGIVPPGRICYYVQE